MHVSRRLASCVIVLALAGSVRAQAVDLTEGPLADGYFHVEISLKLSGKNRFQRDGKTIEQPVSAQAKHQYDEKVLQAVDGVVTKTVRDYKVAQAELKFGDTASRRSFRPGHELLVIQRVGDQHVAFSPKGNLTREEVDLTEHFNTLALTGLLAGKQVKVGDSWTISPSVAQALCSLEGLVGHDVTCKLEEVKGDVAHVKVTGTVDGIDLGAKVKILILGVYQFDLKEKRLTALTWKQTDDREPGPVSPALAADAEITLTRSAIEQPTKLNPGFLNGFLGEGKEPPPELTQVAYQDTGKVFEAKHGRDWIMTAQGEHTVWRLMNRGDLIAQASVTLWRKFPPGKPATFQEFSGVVSEESPVWKQPKRIGNDGQNLVDVPNGNKCYRYCAEGKLSGLDVVQYFYLLISPRGDHLFVTCTMDPKQVENLSSRDVNFVRGISFPTVQEDNGVGLDLQPVRKSGEVGP
jgi:hypothetical protein